MTDTQMFHIYEKETSKPVKVCMTVDELEQMIAERKVDWLRWEIQPCYTPYEVGDASFWDEYKYSNLRAWRIPDHLLY